MSLWQFFVDNTSFLYLTNSCLKQKCYEVHVILLWESVTCLSKTDTIFRISTKNDLETIIEYYLANVMQGSVL